MIDTVRFKIPIDEMLYKQIEASGRTTLDRDNVHNDEFMRYLISDANIGSHDSKITLFLYEQYSAYFEFSLPKQYHGENINLLYPCEVEMALDDIWRRLGSLYPTFPHYKKWQVVRLDVCYAWRLQNGLVEQVLSYLKHLEYPRKNRYVYKTSVMFRGRHYSLKFYLKHEEYMKHDFKKIFEKDPKKAEALMHSSENVLRYEVTIRKEQLKYYFEKPRITVFDITQQEKILEILQVTLSKLLQNRSGESMADDKVLERLKVSYKTDKAMRLFLFYKQYYSDDEQDKRRIKENYSSTTLWRYKRDIANAKVGLPIQDQTPNFDFSIPSKHAVTPDPAVLAEASAAQGGDSNTA